MFLIILQKSIPIIKYSFCFFKDTPCFSLFIEFLFSSHSKLISFIHILYISNKYSSSIKKSPTSPTGCGRLPYDLILYVTDYYLLRFVSSSRSVSETVMIRLLAWNPRCVVIISVNCAERSTFDISNTPVLM